MTGIKELSVKRRKVLVQRINKVMLNEFGIDQESINGFWQTFAIGAKIVKEEAIDYQAKYNAERYKWQRERA